MGGERGPKIDQKSVMLHLNGPVLSVINYIVLGQGIQYVFMTVGDQNQKKYFWNNCIGGDDLTFSRLFQSI
jgi:hypothetical protein